MPNTTDDIIKDEDLVTEQDDVVENTAEADAKVDSNSEAPVETVDESVDAADADADNNSNNTSTEVIDTTNTDTDPESEPEKEIKSESESESESEPKSNIESESKSKPKVSDSDLNLTKGTAIYVMPGIPLYKDASINSVKLNNFINYVRGTLFIWDEHICNGRIRVTRCESGAGNLNDLLGWVNVADLLK